MDVSESSYYSINKFLLTSLGQWPYQRTLHKRLLRIAYACVVISIVVPVILRLIEIWGELDEMMECVSIVVVESGTCLKLANYSFDSDKIKKMFQRIEADRKSKMFNSQRGVLEKYAKQGRTLTQFYTVCMYSTLGTFILMPLVPKLMDIAKPSNETRSLVRLVPVSYGPLDMDKYYVLLMIHADCAAFVAITTIVAIDTTYNVYVQHACGMFAALGNRLEDLMEPSKQNYILDAVALKKLEENTYKNIIDCIEIQKGAIELDTRFANIIESSHSIVFFLVISLSVFCMSVAGYEVVMNLDKPNEAVRFGVFTLSQVSHMFFICWPGQKLIDHSERIFEKVYESKWYEASPRCKKLLMLMMMRSYEPCKLTAGRLFDVSFSSFSMVMKSSMSYFTMLTSFRGER